MPDTPLNLDGIEMATRILVRDKVHHDGKTNSYAITEQMVSAYLAAALPEVTSVEEADGLSVGSVVILRDGTARLRTDWSSGWASAKAGDDYPTDDTGCFPARVLHMPEVPGA
ncbi:hypothetical protein [Glutamicibacter sp. NPDC087344]|uniref:hypothetical protein n=1 Tax=Glutamicibacter sp. NPDC087344 TaxID=3363994 RepID=UPI0038056339